VCVRAREYNTFLCVVSSYVGRCLAVG